MREFSEGCTDHQHPESSGFVGKAKAFWSDITGNA